MTAFTDYVKKIADEQKISYREAMKLAKETYIKPIKVEKSSSEEVKVSPVVEDVKTTPEHLKIVSLTEEHFKPTVIVCEIPVVEKKPRKKRTVAIP
jgi:aspartyl/asparaginyl-tRNA synthetase